MLNRFEYIKPNTLDELVFELSRLGKEANILAGGSDLLVQIKKRRISPRYLIDIMGIPELDQIEEKNGEIRVGSGVGLFSLEGSSPNSEYGNVRWKSLCWGPDAARWIHPIRGVGRFQASASSEGVLRAMS